ncbi:hypothetical protein D3X11_04530 [Streptococcus sp. X16XC17]|uniref:DUF4097 family beta strand repeat-containing protein n=1 Tax=unclassified Streptococcus TaxID=2608887 RepID=UPI00066FDD36|nr:MULTISPECIES: DUF4097 family beta strand repeat-containing protein [unclassified Streptococcus]TCD46647.1 hypothetical protein D3X11_04530 [Streptococcus sp. X16XC17]
MKKKAITTVIIGFTTLMIGLILVGIGFLTGGIQQLTEISQPDQITKDYKGLSAIKVESMPHEVIIQESSDDQFHVTYTDSKNNLGNALQLKQTDKELTVTAKRREFRIKGILQVLGEVLSQEYQNSNTITITIPKNKTLDKFTIQTFSYTSIENSHIKEATITGGLRLQNVQIDSGQLSGYYISVNQSTLKNLTISSHEKNIDLMQSQLENSTIKSYSYLDASELTLKGDNHFTPAKEQLTETNIDLTDQSLQNLNWYIQNKVNKQSLAEGLGYGGFSESELADLYKENQYLQNEFQKIGIFTSDKYEKLPVLSNDKEHTLILDKKESKNKLTIETTNATINIRTPE